MENNAAAPPSSHQPHHQRRLPVKAWFVSSSSSSDGSGGSGTLEGARLECCRGALIQKARPRGPRHLVSVEEAVFLASRGAIEIRRGDGDGEGDDGTTPLSLEEVYAAAFGRDASSSSSHTRYVVFADLRSRGYVVDAPLGSRTQLVCVVASAAAAAAQRKKGGGGGGGSSYTLHLHVVSSEDPLPVEVLSAAPFRHPAPPAAVVQRGDPEAGRKTSVQPALPQRGVQGEGQEGEGGAAVYAVAVVTPVSEVLYYTVSRPMGLPVPAARSGERVEDR